MQNNFRTSRPLPAGPVPAEEGLTTTAASSQTASHRHEAGGETRKLTPYQDKRSGASGEGGRLPPASGCRPRAEAPIPPCLSGGSTSRICWIQPTAAPAALPARDGRSIAGGREKLDNKRGGRKLP